MSVDAQTPKHPVPWQAWNKGRLVGQKRPLKPKDVWPIRVRLEINGSKRDLALFSLAIDSKPRACELVTLKVDDVQAGDMSASARPSFSLKRLERDPSPSRRVARFLPHIRSSTSGKRQSIHVGLESLRPSCDMYCRSVVQRSQKVCNLDMARDCEGRWRRVGRDHPHDQRLRA